MVLRTRTRHIWRLLLGCTVCRILMLRRLPRRVDHAHADGCCVIFVDLVFLYLLRSLVASLDYHYWQVQLLLLRCLLLGLLLR